MEHVAIDLGGRESQICVRRSDGTIVEERRHATRSLGAFLKRRASSRVIVETSAEAFAVADQAKACGHEVRVVPGTLVKSLGVGSRGVKNDRRDAQILSEVSCRIDLPSVHVKSMQARERNAMCSMRESMTRARTQLINCVRGWLRTKVIHIRGGGTETFPARVRMTLLATPEGMPEYVERLLQSIGELTQRLKEADKELGQLARSDATCRRLMTVPGVGPVTSMRFVAALDTIDRFEGPHAVASYLGLTPGEDSSSRRERRLSITKAGSPQVRWTLTQACWSALRTRPKDPMVQWALQVAKRRGRRIAIVALARKMAGILYALWRDGSQYDPRRGATSIQGAPNTMH